MFSGIIECTGRVTSLKTVTGGMRVAIDLKQAAQGVKKGDSISVNGVCLTIADMKKGIASFDVITETLSKTNFSQLQVGHKANLERSLQIGGRLDGHFVQGHVDNIGRVVKRLVTKKEFKLWLRPSPGLNLYIVPRGSVAINGVSMTVAEVRKNDFAIALIPTTLARTNLGDLGVGDAVNIETDIIARQIVHLLNNLLHQAPGKINR